ncbi:MAG: flagellar biosynthetic protein FliO [Luteimonas sp.]
MPTPRSFARHAVSVLAVLAIVPALAWAAPATTSPAAVAAAMPAESSSALGELLGIVLPLALLIVALLAVLYLLRRRFGLTGQDAPLTILQILPVGPRERLVLVRSRAGRVFAIGVASQNVRFITNLEPADLETPIPAARAEPLI